MRAALATTVGFLAAIAIAADSKTTCAKDLYILCARGSGEAAVAPKAGTYPDNTGSPGILALQVQKQIPGADIARSTGSLDLPGYYSSEGKGAKAVVEELDQYHSACPDTKIAIIGYSQGAQAVQDALCGGTGDPFNSEAPASPELVKKNVIAIALIADPTHIANTSYDHGTSVHDGVFPRKNTKVCDQYDDLMGSWCGKNDRFCDSGNNDTEHAIAWMTYEAEVVKFVVENWKNSASHSDSGSTATATTGSSTSAASTASPTSTPSGKTSSASDLAWNQGLLLGAVAMFAVWSLH